MSRRTPRSGLVDVLASERDEARQERDAAGRVAELAVFDAARLKRERDEARSRVDHQARLLQAVNALAPHAVRAAEESLEGPRR